MKKAVPFPAKSPGQFKIPTVSHSTSFSVPNPRPGLAPISSVPVKQSAVPLLEPAGPAKPALYKSLRVTVWIHSGAILFLAFLLTLLLVKHLGSTSTSSTTATRLDGANSVIHFLLVPNDNATGSMRISLEHYAVDVASLEDYSICCRIKNQLVCGKQNRELGVAAYFTFEPAVYIQSASSRMLGAACKLTWKVQ